jgi:Fic family protein
MATVVTRKKGNNAYYYLNHNAGGRQREVYLGKSIPKNIEQLKKQLVLDFYRDGWLPKLEAIHEAFQKNLKIMPKSALQEELEEFSIHFTYNTQRIEGSTLTKNDVFNLLKFGLTPPRKPQYDTVEATEHKKIFLEMLVEKRPLSLGLVLHWHKRMFEQTKPQFAGRIRTFNVGITNSESRFPNWTIVQKSLVGFFKWYSANKKKLNPAELAALAHLKFVTIHPFGDGNGRVSRLLMNYVLHHFGCPMFDIKYEDRVFYYRSLEKSNLQDNEFPFLNWFMKRYIGFYKKLV